MMLKKIVLILLMISITFTLALGVDLKSLSHTDKELNIIVVNQKNLSRLSQLISSPQGSKFLVVQVQPSKLSPKDIKLLQDWVKAGGSLWVYDSRLAAYFDLHSSPLSDKEFEHKPFKGDFGAEGKLPGGAAIATGIGNHPLLAGVNSVAVFLLEIEKDKYSALDIEKDMIPLLKVNKENKTVCAVKAYGKGWLVFKPLLWEEDLDGAKFQLNLKEFSAGFPIPTTEKAESGNFGISDNANRDLDKIYLKNGKVIAGKILNDDFTFETDQGKLTFKKNNLEAIYIQNKGGLDKAQLKDGKLAVGYLSLGEELLIKTLEGKTVNLDKALISKILFKL
jgi:hypothetical protein